MKNYKLTLLLALLMLVVSSCKKDGIKTTGVIVYNPIADCHSYYFIEDNTLKIYTFNKVHKRFYRNGLHVKISYKIDYEFRNAFCPYSVIEILNIKKIDK